MVSPCWASSFLCSCKETEPKKHAPTHKPFIKSDEGFPRHSWWLRRLRNSRIKKAWFAQTSSQIKLQEQFLNMLCMARRVKGMDALNKASASITRSSAWSMGNLKVCRSLRFWLCFPLSFAGHCGTVGKFAREGEFSFVEQGSESKRPGSGTITNKSWITLAEQELTMHGYPKGKWLKGGILLVTFLMLL